MKKKTDLKERASIQMQGAALPYSVSGKTAQQYKDAHEEKPKPTKEQAQDCVLEGLDPQTKMMMVSLFQKIDELKEQINRSHPRKKKQRENDVRFTLNCPKEDLEKIREIAHDTKQQIRDVVVSAFELYIEEYEKENGIVKIIEKVNK